MSASNIVYRDIDLEFRPNPVSGDVSVKTNVESVRQSILTILTTNKREKLFSPLFGSSIRSLLFENMSPIVQAMLRQRIHYAIQSFEPRVDILGIGVTSNYEKNGYDITVAVLIRGTQQKVVLPVFLERAR